jgi:hypothetical protein
MRFPPPTPTRPGVLGTLGFAPFVAADQYGSVNNVNCMKQRIESHNFSHFAYKTTVFKY